MKCEKGFKEENGKCVREHIDTYCDTNVLTAFVSRDSLKRHFGKRGLREYPNIRKDENNRAILKSKNINICSISKEALLNDMKGHQSSMGSALTTIGFKDIEVVDVDGIEEGEKIFKRMCNITDPSLDEFKKNFCFKDTLKRNLKRNQIEDIRHLGSAIKLGKKYFLTADKKDFQPLNKHLREINII